MGLTSQSPSTAHPSQQDQSWMKAAWMTGGGLKQVVGSGWSPGGHHLGQGLEGSRFLELTFCAVDPWGQRGTQAHQCTWEWRERWQGQLGHRRTGVSR